MGEITNILLGKSPIPRIYIFYIFFPIPRNYIFFVFKMTLFEIIVGASLIVLVSGSRINGVKRMNAPKLDSLEDGVLGKPTEKPLPDTNSDHQTKGVNAQPEPPPPPEHLQINRMGPQMIIKELLEDGVLGKPTEKPLPDTNSDHQTKGVNAQPEPPPPPEHLQINRMGPQMIIKEFMGDITKRTGWLKATVEKNERELKGKITAAKTELETKINAVKSDMINIHTKRLKISNALMGEITAAKTEL